MKPTLPKNQHQRHYKQLQTNISHEHRCKNLQQNISKLNITVYKRNYILYCIYLYIIYTVFILYIKRVINHDWVGFIPGMQGWFTIRKSIIVIHYINRLKEENHMIMSIYVKKEFDKIYHQSMTKTLSKLGTEGNIFKLIPKKSTKTYNWHHNGENLGASQIKSRTRYGYPFSPLVFNIVP